MTRVFRLGTRGSMLARTQSGHVAEALESASGHPVELVIIKTRGDEVQDRPLAQVGGKGLFTKEIEEALLAGTVDLAVHSMKDLPSENPPGLIVAGIPLREDPRDVLVGSPLADLSAGDVVGTGSLRRMLQLRALIPGLEIRGLRGNVDTRVRKQRDGEYKSVVLAAAGLSRLGRADDIGERLDVDAMIPAVGQGALAVQCREDDAEVRGWLEKMTDPATADAVAAERGFLIALGGGCSVPAACHATVEGDNLRIRAFLGAEDGRAEREIVVCTRGDGRRVGGEIAVRLLAKLG